MPTNRRNTLCPNGKRERETDYIINSLAFLGGLYISLDPRLFTGCPEFGKLVRSCLMDLALISRGQNVYRLPIEALKPSSMFYSYLTSLDLRHKIRVIFSSSCLRGM